jgi:SAM-dependent methyltransferase
MADMTAGQSETLWANTLRRSVRSRVKRLLGVGAPDVGAVRWGSLRRTSPISGNFGFDRGTPIDRFYIGDFLSRWSADIKGRVLEVKDSHYTRRFGGAQVSRSDILDIDSKNPRATIVADLNAAAELPDDQFDCILLTQTLQFVYSFDAAVRDLHRSLKPGGVLLMTVPGLTPLRTRRMDWYWSFTDLAVQRLLSKHFDPAQLQLTTYGNLLSATAFLYGVSSEELRAAELAFSDPDYQVIVAARAVRSA